MFVLLFCVSATYTTGKRTQKNFDSPPVLGMSAANELKATNSAEDSINSNTPFNTNNNMDSNNMDSNNDQDSNNHMHVPQQQSLHDGNNSTMIIKDTDLQSIKVELENEDKDNDENGKSEAIPMYTPSINNLQTNEDNNEHSHSLSNKSNGSIGSITRQSNITDKPKSPQANPLDTTKLRHDGGDVEIGAISDDENSPVITPYGAHHESRMPRFCLFLSLFLSLSLSLRFCDDRSIIR